VGPEGRRFYRGSGCLPRARGELHSQHALGGEQKNRQRGSKREAVKKIKTEVRDISNKLRKGNLLRIEAGGQGKAGSILRFKGKDQQREGQRSGKGRLLAQTEAKKRLCSVIKGGRE